MARPRKTVDQVAVSNKIRDKQLIDTAGLLRVISKKLRRAPTDVIMQIAEECGIVPIMVVSDDSTVTSDYNTSRLPGPVYAIPITPTKAWWELKAEEEGNLNEDLEEI